MWNERVSPPGPIKLSINFFVWSDYCLTWRITKSLESAKKSEKETYNGPIKRNSRTHEKVFDSPKVWAPVNERVSRFPKKEKTWKRREINQKKLEYQKCFKRVSMLEGHWRTQNNIFSTADVVNLHYIISKFNSMIHKTLRKWWDKSGTFKKVCIPIHLTAFQNRENNLHS